MGSEPLYVPESKLREVISILRAGMEHVKVSRVTERALVKWCRDEEGYLADLEAD